MFSGEDLLRRLQGGSNNRCRLVAWYYKCCIRSIPLFRIIYIIFKENQEWREGVKKRRPEEYYYASGQGELLGDDKPSSSVSNNVVQDQQPALIGL